MAVKDRVDTADAVLSFGIKIAVIVLVLSMVWKPAPFIAIADRWRVGEVDIWGVKITRALAEVKQHSDDVTAQFSAVSDKLAVNDATLRANKAVLARSGAPGSARQVEAIDRLLVSNEVTLKAAQTSLAQGATIAATTSQTVATAQIRSAPAGSDWGIVFGADTDVVAEQHEASLANKAGLGAVKIYHRGGWYRSVIEYADRNRAAADLARVQTLSRYSANAYIVNLTTWCAGTGVAAGGVVDCEAPG